MDLSPAPRPDVALLVDADNMSHDLAIKMMKAASCHGTPRVRRAYGSAEAVAGWQNNGFRLCPARPGKNSADMLLCVEAMALALRDGFATLVIATSDRDFTYLAEYLRETGKQVIGLGTVKAPKAFQSSCSRFVLLDAADPVAPPPAKPDAIVDRLRRAIALAGPAGLPLCKLGATAVNGGFKVSETPEKGWRKWLEARSAQFMLDPRGPDARVRLRG